MDNDLGYFPFGHKVKIIKQLDTSPKKVFVLGVYASAVHAKWIGPDNKVLIKALAVASEPEIFWSGENADKIIESIKIPDGSGRLVPADTQFNGPSGKTLDELILNPMGFTRGDAWLCDLVPYSCLNDQQSKALRRIKEEKKIPWSPLYESSVPELPKNLASPKRVAEIFAELKSSMAEILILLGDQPIRWFLHHFDPRWKRLSDFIEHGEGYGLLHKINLDVLKIKVLPLAHPRQIAKLGKSNTKWFDMHQCWLKLKGFHIDTVDQSS